MLNDKYFKTNDLKLLIIDEADELLSIGFEEQLKNIIDIINRKIQIGLFSATLSEHCLEVTKYFMKDPISIFVKSDELTLEGIKQYYINVEKMKITFWIFCNNR